MTLTERISAVLDGAVVPVTTTALVLLAKRPRHRDAKGSVWAALLQISAHQRDKTVIGAALLDARDRAQPRAQRIGDDVHSAVTVLLGHLAEGGQIDHIDRLEWGQRGDII